MKIQKNLWICEVCGNVAGRRLFHWRRIYVMLEGLADVLADLENNLTTITGGE